MKKMINAMLFFSILATSTNAFERSEDDIIDDLYLNEVEATMFQDEQVAHLDEELRLEEKQKYYVRPQAHKQAQLSSSHYELEPHTGRRVARYEDLDDQEASLFLEEDLEKEDLFLDDAIIVQGKSTKRSAYRGRSIASTEQFEIEHLDEDEYVDNSIYVKSRPSKKRLAPIRRYYRATNEDYLAR